MSSSPNDSKRSPGGNRYNFNQPPFENIEQDWRVPDPYGSAENQAQDFRAQPSDDQDRSWHQPAPMQKRPMPPAQKRNRKAPGKRWSTFTIVALIGLASFVFVVDLAGGGKLRHLIMPESSPPETLDLGQAENSEVPTPPKISEAPQPVPQPAPVVETAQADPPQVALIPEPAQIPQVAPKPVAEVAAAAPKAVEVTPEPQVKAAPALPQIVQGQVVRDCADCPELIAVSAGSYVTTNGSTQERVSINSDFAIGRNAITFQDWDKCVSDGACSPIANDAGWGRGNRPLIFVSFDDVTTQYLPWLSKLTGKAYRLPSKDEWQYAALGGQGGAAKTTNQIRAASQDCFNASGPAPENCADTFDGTSPVGSFAPNTLGLNDMKGNVWAWSMDCWQPFTNAPPVKSDACEMRVLLGGAWSTKRDDVTAFFSGWEKSSRTTNSIGFRVVRNLP